MKMLIQSLLFIIIVGLFAVTSDRLTKMEQKESMGISPKNESMMSDQDFLLQMIEHHEGAIEMATQVIVQTDRAEIRDLASNIISSQSQEIILMKEWMGAWYGK